MIFLGILIGLILQLPIGFIKWKKKTPINYPKGIPDDASTGYLYKCDQWDGDAHSHSFFTLEELLNVDWSEYDSEYIDDFMETLEKMKKIDEDPSKVRCCFFFDN